MRWMRAHIFSRPSSLRRVSRLSGWFVVFRGGEVDILGFANAADQLVPSVAHDGTDAEQEDARPEAFGG